MHGSGILGSVDGDDSDCGAGDVNIPSCSKLPKPHPRHSMAQWGEDHTRRVKHMFYICFLTIAGGHNIKMEGKLWNF